METTRQDKIPSAVFEINSVGLVDRTLFRQDFFLIEIHFRMVFRFDATTPYYHIMRRRDEWMTQPLAAAAALLRNWHPVCMACPAKQPASVNNDG